MDYFTLNHRVAFYVPSTVEGNKQIDPAELEGTVTIYPKGGQYHIVGRFDGQVYKVRSQNIDRAVSYAQEWLYIYQ